MTVQPPPIGKLCEHNRKPEHCATCDPEYKSSRRPRDPDFVDQTYEQRRRKLVEAAVDLAFERNGDRLK